MKTTVAIYDSHWTALDAVEILKNINFPVSQISIMGKAKEVEEYIYVKPKSKMNKTTVSLGVVLGSTLGVLPGARIIPIPGLGYIIGAGAVRRALDDFSAGLGKGEIASIFNTVGINNEQVIIYSEHLKDGKYLLIAQGNEEEIEKAENIFCSSGKHFASNI